MAIEAVVIQFAARGMQDVTRAFDTIEQRMVRAERTGTTTTNRESAARVRSTNTEVDQRRRAIDKLAQDVAKSQERQAKQVEQIRRRSSEMAGRAAAQEARTEVREAEKAAREIERIEEWKMRVKIRSSEMAGRMARREAEKEAQANRQASRATSGALKRGASTGLRFAGMAAGALSMGGGFAVADAVRGQLAAEKQAALLINTVTTGSAPPAGATMGNVLGQASVLSGQTGMSKSDLIGGALEYSRKARGGDFQGAMDNLPFFAKMAQVTGADINDIAASAGTLQSQNPELAGKNSPQMQQMLLDVYAQGKAGSMSMVDVAKQIGTLASTRGSYAGDTATNQRKLLALGQLAAPEGSVEEAGTYIKDLTSEAGSHRKGSRKRPGLESMGVKYDKFGRMESPEQMIDAVFKSTKGDITKIEEIFGKRGTALFRSLQPEYVKAGGGDAGIAAVNAKMSSVTSATMTPEQLESQHAQTMSTPAMRLQAAWEKLESTVGDKLEPALSKLADKAPEVAKVIGEIAEKGVELLTWLADNKWQGLGAIVAASITKEIASAQIGRILSTAIQSGAATKMSGGISIASAAITAAVVTEMVVDMLAAEDVKKQQSDVASSVEAANTAATVHDNVRTGKVTATDINKVETQLTAAKGRQAAAEGGPSIGQFALASLSGLMGGALTGQSQAILDEGNARRAQELKSATQDVTMLSKAAKEAAEALRAVATNAPPRSGAPPGPIGQGPR